VQILFTFRARRVEHPEKAAGKVLVSPLQIRVRHRNLTRYSGYSAAQTKIKDESRSNGIATEKKSAGATQRLRSHVTSQVGPTRDSVGVELGRAQVLPMRICWLRALSTGGSSTASNARPTLDANMNDSRRHSIGRTSRWNAATRLS
jgi:hypothetical protein